MPVSACRVALRHRIGSGDCQHETIWKADACASGQCAAGLEHVADARVAGTFVEARRVSQPDQKEPG